MLLCCCFEQKAVTKPSREGFINVPREYCNIKLESLNRTEEFQKENLDCREAEL
ncbi:rCG60920, isoform CRA_b [Rattus norvegicus]|uniref:RCG60920, isoform CRA_b n=1 Tax=Rattus norvegicus TaxID=10116 RepID=A6JKQ1_RAT|nr:rCG60920, isoform CRA_b [Rattus norvegicus]